LGSAAVFFHVRRLFEPREIHLSDGNAELIDVYLTLRDDREALIRLLGKHKRAHSREHFYRVRSQDAAALTVLQRAARMIYLNKTCFNGLYRVNSKGEFNVPIGRYQDPAILDVENLRAVAEALAGVALSHAHFGEILRHARKGDFVYFDPPYQPLSSTSSFTSYTKGDFGPKDQEELAEVYRDLGARGCQVMLSNSDTSFVRHLYRGFEVRTVSALRTINSKGHKRGKISEVVVLNYEPAGEAKVPTRLSSGAGRRRSPPPPTTP
jgi:DNA adenine methylase